jgi:hypothetical protein
MWEWLGGGEIERYEEKIKRCGHFVYGFARTMCDYGRNRHWQNPII